MTDDGPRFWLPPIRLPAFFPEDLRFLPPIPRSVRGSGNRLLAALVLDLLDAAVVVWAGGGLPRVAAGTLLAAVLVGRIGLGYAWEALPAVVGPGWLGVAPSATLLVLLDRRRD